MSLATEICVELLVLLEKHFLSGYAVFNLLFRAYQVFFLFRFFEQSIQFSLHIDYGVLELFYFGFRCVLR